MSDTVQVTIEPVTVGVSAADRPPATVSVGGAVRGPEVQDGDKGDISVAGGIWSLDQNAPNILNKVAHVPTRAALADASSAAPIRFLTEDEIEGVWLWKAGDHSALVAADPGRREALVVAPTSDRTGASGVWMRDLKGWVDPRWWGWQVGDDGALAASNAAAFEAMQQELVAHALHDDPANFARVLLSVQLPVGISHLGNNGVGAGIELKYGTIEVRGASASIKQLISVTKLKIAAGLDCIRVQAANTEGATGIRPNGYNGVGSVIENICIEGPWGTAQVEAEAHGVHRRGAASCRNVLVRWMQGDGFYEYGSASDPRSGNTNVSETLSCSAVRCRNGLRVDGDNNANAGRILGFNASSNRQWGIWISSYGHEVSGCHVSNLGTPAYGSPPCAVSFNGSLYFVIRNQEPWANANPPSGDTTTNQGWAYLGAGGPSLSYPAYDPLVTYRAGGGYCADGNNRQQLFNNCYDENNGTRSQIFSPAVVLHGTLALGLWRGNSSNIMAPVISSDSGGRVLAWNGLTALRGTLEVRIAGSTDEIFRITDPVRTPGNSSLRLRFSGNDLLLSRSSSATAVALMIGTEASASAFGSGQANFEWFMAPRLRIPDGSNLVSTTLGRALVVGIAAPTAGEYGVGSWCLDRSTTVRAIGRKCTVAGAPGNWSGLLYGLTVEPTAAGEAMVAANDAAAQRALLSLAAIATTGATADLVGELTPEQLPDNSAGPGNYHIHISGGFIDTGGITAGMTTVAGVADRLVVYPWSPPRDTAVDQIGVAVSTAVAGSNAKVVAYESDPNTGAPGALIFETADISCAATGFAFEARAQTFLKGRVYWLGVRTSSTQTLRAHSGTAMRAIGRTSGAASSNATAILISRPFATAAENPFGPVATGDLSAPNAAAVIMRLV